MPRFLVIKKFVTWLLLIVAFLFLLLFAGYIYFDPFRVLRCHENAQNVHVIPNREYIGVEKFLANRDRYPYNAFIFGSSRASAFQPHQWKKYLDSASQPYTLDASSENLYGQYQKIRFLDSLHQPLTHVLLILDRDNSFRTKRDSMGYPFLRHPSLAGSSKWDFQWTFFKLYFTTRTIKSFYVYAMTHEYESYMANRIVSSHITYDAVSNEIDMTEAEQGVRADSIGYYAKMKENLYDREGEKMDSVTRFTGVYLAMIDSIRQILLRNHSDYRIVMGPGYDEVRISEADRRILSDRFGDRFFDFSGRNGFTERKGNYYDINHFRPSVGDSILRIIYSPHSAAPGMPKAPPRTPA